MDAKKAVTDTKKQKGTRIAGKGEMNTETAYKTYEHVSPGGNESGGNKPGKDISPGISPAGEIGEISFPGIRPAYRPGQNK